MTKGSNNNNNKTLLYIFSHFSRPIDRPPATRQNTGGSLKSHRKFSRVRRSLIYDRRPQQHCVCPRAGPSTYRTLHYSLAVKCFIMRSIATTNHTAQIKNMLARSGFLCVCVDVLLIGNRSAGIRSAQAFTFRRFAFVCRLCDFGLCYNRLYKNTTTILCHPHASRRRAAVCRLCCAAAAAARRCCAPLLRFCMRVKCVRVCLLCVCFVSVNMNINRSVARYANYHMYRNAPRDDARTSNISGHAIRPKLCALTRYDDYDYAAAAGYQITRLR